VIATLQLVRPRAANALGAVLLAPALSALAKIIFEWQKVALPLPSRVEHGDLLQGLAGIPLSMRILLLAISPAVCEELFFRGAFLSGLRRDLSVVSCLAWEAVLFGAAHSSIYRFVPTAILGMVLAAITLRGRSLLPAILLHATYNLLLLGDVESPMLVWLAAPGLLLLTLVSPSNRGGS
jgi:sodium transport system permease protein